MLEKRIRSNVGRTNVRAKASALVGVEILDVLNADFVDCLVSDDFATAAWVQVEYTNAEHKLIKGYVSRQYVEIAQRVIVPPPDPSFMVDFTITMTEDVRAAFQTIATALANAKQV